MNKAYLNGNPGREAFKEVSITGTVGDAIYHAPVAFECMFCGDQHTMDQIANPSLPACKGCITIIRKIIQDKKDGIL